MSGTYHHPSDDDDDSATDRLPSQSTGRRRGWQGEELELEHQRRQVSANNKAAVGAAVAAAVDLDQFRNTEVGKGYQAKHVVRQATAAAASVTIQDMSLPSAREEEERHREKSSSSDKKKKKKRKRHSSGGKRRKKSKEEGDDDHQSSRLKRYLRSDALRRFRKELQKIEASDIAS